MQGVGELLRARRTPANPRLRVVLVVMASLRLARAEDPGLDETRATGDWAGARTELAKRGLFVGLDYTAESFARPRHIAATVTATPAADIDAATNDGVAVTYRGTVDFTFVAALGPLGLVPGGMLFLFAQHGHGEGPSPPLGLAMPVSNLEAAPFTQVSELWYEQLLFGDRLRLKLGKQDGNTDFLAPGSAAPFANSSFGVPPTLPLPSFPSPALGALVDVMPVGGLSLRAAVYDGRVPTRATRPGISFPSDSALLVAAAAWTEPLGKLQLDVVGVSVGAWHHQADLRVGEATFGANFGAFALADVQLAVSGTEVAPLRLFARAAWAAADRNAIDWYVGGGTTYRGFASSDTSGIGAGRVRTRALGLSRAGSETFVELFYQAVIRFWLSVQPEVQLVVQRGVIQRVACVAGVRVKLSF